MKYFVVIFLFSFVFYSCEDESDIVYPDTDPDDILEHVTLLNENSKMIMEGIYEIIKGTEEFGEKAVIKWNQNHLNIFFAKNAGYIVMQGGAIDSIILFKGYWRHLVNTNTGVVNFIIDKDSGYVDIINGNSLDTNIVLSGKYGKGKSLPEFPIMLKYLRPISETARYNTFYIMGHRCGGRNAEQLGVSENSVEMIRKSVELGVNGIEMDVRTSEDNIQFIYHDNDVNLRLTQPSLLIGKIESYTFAELRSFLKLANGEKIPSLKEALEEVLKQPHIKLVWLDCKSEKNDVQMIRNIQKEFMDRAVAMGRELKIMMGIPEEEKFNQVKGLSGFNSILTLCELDLTKVRELNSEFWGSRWTEGIQQDKINEMHSEGRKVISWTLDEPLFIQQYVENANFDGILSNYPPLVAYYHYMQ